MLTGEIPEKINEFISNEFAKQSDINKIVRLICIESLVQNGISPKLYDNMKLEFLRVINLINHSFIQLGVWLPRDILT